MSSVVTRAILRLEPNSKFVVRGSIDDYEIEWHSQDITQPSDSDIAASIAIIQGLSYQLDREKEYPSIGDQLDALFRAGVFPDDMAASIQAVKDKFPKPEV